jgi:hypothetical protein
LGVLFPKNQVRHNTPFPLTNAIINSLLGASTVDAKKGIFKFPFGDFWEKSQTMQGGAVPIRKYQLSLKKLIESGKAIPGFIFDKEIRIEGAGKAYIGFSDHDFIKTVIRFGDDPEKLIEDENGEKVHLEKKRKRNGVSHRVRKP